MDPSTSRLQGNSPFGGLLAAASAAGLIFYGLKRRDVPGLLFTLAGVGVVGRGPLRKAVRRASQLHKEPVRVVSALTVRSTLDEVYDRMCSPRGVFASVESIGTRPDGSTRWTINLKGIRVLMDFRIESKQRPQRLVFRALDTGYLQGEGSIEFQPAPGDQGTEVRLNLAITPTFKPLRFAAHALGNMIRLAIFEELVRVRELIETGEIATAAMRLPSEQSESRERRREPESVPAGADVPREAHTARESDR